MRVGPLLFVLLAAAPCVGALAGAPPGHAAGAVERTSTDHPAREDLRAASVTALPGVTWPAVPVSPGPCAASPPCGFVVPIIDLDFGGKSRCGSAVPGAVCLALPDDGESLGFAGNVTWWWRESEDLVYPPGQGEPIVLSFGPVGGAPAWWTFSADPPSYTIGSADLFDPRNSRTDTSGPVPVVDYWFHRPVNITFHRQGSPDGAASRELARRGGVLEAYVRAASTPSGSTYAAAFGLAIFRFDATALAPAVPAQEAPGTGMAPLAAACAGGAAVMRASRSGRAGRRA